MVYEILNDIGEGLILLNRDLEIIYWNPYMERIMGKEQIKVLENNLLKVIPQLNKKCFLDAFENTMRAGWVSFFSAAMHKELVIPSGNYNLKISRIDNEGSRFLLLEYINVTSQSQQINQLKTYVNDLYMANKELKEQKTRIKQLAYYDSLTGVANRTLFYQIANEWLERSKEEHLLLGLMFVDVNKFKSINDTYGHKIGDEILVRVANMLVNATRKNDVVVRYGGDEFLILLPNMNDIENYNIVVSRIFEIKNNTMEFDECEIPISLSIGISFYPDDGDTIDTLLKKADEAMYIAKRSEGEDRYYYSA